MKIRFLLFLLLMFPLSSIFAQVPTDLDPAKDPGSLLNVELIPSNPSSNQNVKVNLTSYITNIDNAQITWTVNGVNKKSGKGEKYFLFTTGPSGTETKLNIRVVTQEGISINRTIDIKPADVDLVWESDGYVPPFYKGKSNYGHLNTLRLIALPHLTDKNGDEISSKSLVYKWIKNGEVLDWASGYGKDSFNLIVPIISKPVEIEVQASSPVTGYMAISRVNAIPVKPMVLLYKKDPLYGIQFQTALKNTVEMNNTKEITVVSYPYFYENPKFGNLSFTWKINGIPIGNDSTIRQQTFRKKDGVSGASEISLSIENLDKILQYSSERFMLRFNDVNQNQNSL